MNESQKPLAVVRLHRSAEIASRHARSRGKPQVRGGGDEGNRTPNPRLAKAVLCQLSYVP